MASPGGNTIHAGRRRADLGVPVGVVARVGADFPAAALDRLRDAGIDTTGLDRIAGPTVRNWVVYEEDGRRSWVYRTPPERSLEVAPRPEDIPAGWTGAGRTVPRSSTSRPCRSLPPPASSSSTSAPRGGRPVVTLDTHEAWDGGAGRGRRPRARRSTCSCPAAGSSQRSSATTTPERGCAELLDEGVPAVVVKCGPKARSWHAGGPATTVAAPEVDVVDVTGAGDSLLRWARRRLGPRGAAGSSPPNGARRRPGPPSGPAARCACSVAEPIGGAAVAPLRAGARRRVSKTLPKPAEADDSDVMEREIATIPEVIRDRLELSAQAASTAERFARPASAISSSSDAGTRSSPARQRSWPSTATPGCRPRRARPRLRPLRGALPPEATAVVAVSFSGKTGRTIEAARQASAFGHQVIGLTGAPDSPIAKAADQSSCRPRSPPSASRPARAPTPPCSSPC